MQMHLGHRVAQRVVVPLAQLLVEMLHREAAIEVAVQPQHPLDLRHRRTPQRRSQPAIGQTNSPPRHGSGRASGGTSAR